MTQSAPTHTEAERAILEYVYDRPEDSHSTESLTSALLDGLQEAARQRAVKTKSVLGGWDDESAGVEPILTRKSLQRDIETLIVKRLVIGRRRGTPGEIKYADVALTPKGEAEAIVIKYPPPKRRIVSDI